MPPIQNLVKLRGLAVRTLAQVLGVSRNRHGVSVEDAMTHVLSQASKNTAPDFDRAWIYEMVSGVLRYKGRLDFIIDTYALKKKPTGPLRRYLYTAVYQLLAQEVASALVVSETVEAVRLEDGDQPAKFTNAILRKVADQRDAWQAWKVSEATPLEEQIAWSSLPVWLFHRLRKAYGLPWVFQFSEAVLSRPELWYFDWEKKQPIKMTDGFTGNESAGFVQDISNQNLVKAVAGFLHSEKISGPVLDLCAAPGGKTLGLLSQGLQVVATDRDQDRLSRLMENKSRLKITDSQCDIREYDSLFSSDQRWGAIWLDVPCLSTGVIRRHPEIRWNRTDGDLNGLVRAQQSLVEWARDHLLPNGILIYSTCSLLPDENPRELKGFQLVEKHVWFPQVDPHGDGMMSAIFRLQ